MRAGDPPGWKGREGEAGTPCPPSSGGDGPARCCRLGPVERVQRGREGLEGQALREREGRL